MPEGAEFRLRSVRYSRAALDAAQDAIDAARSDLNDQGIRILLTGLDDETNTVVIGVEDLTLEKEAALRARFGDIASFRDEGSSTVSPETSAGIEPATKLAPDNLRVLAESLRGDAPRIELATTASEFAETWSRRFTDPLPSVDFDSALVLFFHALVEGNCPELLFDGLEVQSANRLVYGLFTRPPGSDQSKCLDIAGSHVFVVAVPRDKLPTGLVRFRLEREFTICPECGTQCADCEREREEIEVDLPATH